MTLEEFDSLYANNLSHDKIEIACDVCGEKRTPLKTRAKQTIQKTGNYLCPSCGQANRHNNNPMSEEVKQKIGKGVKNYHKQKKRNNPSVS